MKKGLMLLLVMVYGSLSGQTGTIFVSPDGNDTNDGKTAPVKTVAAALKKAEAGNGPDEVIELAAGTYDALDISNTWINSAGWTKNLVVQGAPGALAVMGGITVGPPRLTFKYITIDGGGARINKYADYTRMEQVVVKGTGGFTCIGADSCVWFRCFAVDSFAQSLDRIRFGGDDLDEVPLGMLVEECYFRGSHISGSAGNHIDNIQIIGCDGLTFKNSVFWQAPTGVCMTGPAVGTSYMKDITWDGCYLGEGAFYTSAGTYENVHIRNCILNQGPRYSDTPGTMGDIWENNSILYWSEGYAWPDSFVGNTIKVTGWNASKPTSREVPEGNTKDPDLVLERPVIPEPQLNPGPDGVVMPVPAALPAGILPNPVTAGVICRIIGCAGGDITLFNTGGEKVEALDRMEGGIYVVRSQTGIIMPVTVVK